MDRGHNDEGRALAAEAVRTGKPLTHAFLIDYYFDGDVRGLLHFGQFMDTSSKKGWVGGMVKNIGRRTGDKRRRNAKGLELHGVGRRRWHVEFFFIITGLCAILSNRETSIRGYAIPSTCFSLLSIIQKVYRYVV